jgi:hypothetical protein
MEKLENTVQQLLSYTKQGNSLNEKVSNANVGWHIDHCLMVLNGVLTQLEKSDENDFKSSFNKNRFIVFLTNKIPKGRAKAPEAVKPTEAFNQEKTAFYGEKAIQKIEASINWPTNKNFKHPFFGLLNKKQTIKFLNIHTNHHLKIIKKIINS